MESQKTEFDGFNKHLAAPQLINEENVKGVVSMNEDYELTLFSNNAEVTLCNY